MKVNIRLLGEFALDIDGRPVPASAFPRRSAAALVKLLALAPSRRLHREQVMDALWPGLAPQDAANNLHKRELRALGELIKVSWGKDEPGFRQVYDARFLPDGPLEVWRAFDKLQRMSTSPENAYRLWRAFGALDVSADAARLSVPTLILHSKDDQVWRFREAEELQSLVPGSRLVELNSKNHILRADEPAFEMLMDEVNQFLATDNVPGPALRQPR